MSQKLPVFVVGVNGPANSGKTYYCHKFKQFAEKKGLKVSILKERNFLKPVSIKDEEDR